MATANAQARSKAARSVAKGRKPPRDLAKEEAERRERAIWTVRDFAVTFGLSQDTVTKAIRAAKVEPASANGYLKYHVRDVFDAVYLRDANGHPDPDKMDQYRRKAYYEALRIQLELAIKAGKFIALDDSTAEQARVAKIYTRGLEILVDQVEREGLMPPEKIARLEVILNALRREMADEIEGKDEPPDEGAKE